MNEQTDKPSEETEAEESELKGTGKNKFSKSGKLFLGAAVILLQGYAAHAVVKNNYAEIRELTSSLRSEGGYYYQLENVIVNPAGSNRDRYLILSMAFEMDNKGDQEAFESHRVEIMDKINFTLSKKSLVYFTDQGQRDSMKDDLRQEVDSLFGERLVRNLYFTKYLIQ